jgi:hypothetical protein
VRLRGLDVLRGLAVLLMVLDHWIDSRCVSSLFFVRLTLTRFALPLFVVTFGYLVGRRGSPVSAFRCGQLLCVSSLTLLLFAVAGLDCPDILFLLALLACGSRVWLAWPLPVAVLGLLQAQYWVVPWNAYQPGWVLCFACLGVFASRSLGCPVAAWRCGPLEWVGRRPLGCYVAHAAALALWRILFPGVW